MGNGKTQFAPRTLKYSRGRGTFGKQLGGCCVSAWVGHIEVCRSEAWTHVHGNFNRTLSQCKPCGEAEFAPRTLNAVET